ncbi:unnamed protein product, partial [Amoebophrya sp. A25]
GVQNDQGENKSTTRGAAVKDDSANQKPLYEASSSASVIGPDAAPSCATVKKPSLVSSQSSGMAYSSS